MQMINWNEFNALKQDAFSCKTEEQWQTVKHRYEEMVETYDEETRKYFKEKTVPQLQTLYERKKAYWEKQKQHPQIVKNNFIFREEEGQAFTRLCNALAELLEKQARPTTVYTPTITANDEGGTTTQGDGENVPDSEQTSKKEQ